MQIRMLNRVVQVVSVLAVVWGGFLIYQDEMTNGWLTLMVFTTLASVGTQFLVFEQEKRGGSSDKDHDR